MNLYHLHKISCGLSCSTQFFGWFIFVKSLLFFSFITCINVFLLNSEIYPAGKLFKNPTLCQNILIILSMLFQLQYISPFKETLICDDRNPQLIFTNGNSISFVNEGNLSSVSDASGYCRLLKYSRWAKREYSLWAAIFRHAPERSSLTRMCLNFFYALWMSQIPDAPNLCCGRITKFQNHADNSHKLGKLCQRCG